MVQPLAKYNIVPLSITTKNFRPLRVKAIKASKHQTGFKKVGI
jgi:hypothetical protein